ncbi:MAG: hypothetical protein R3A79_07135 [Nannocystaceae bacterium]
MRGDPPRRGARYSAKKRKYAHTPPRPRLIRSSAGLSRMIMMMRGDPRAEARYSAKKRK